MLANILDLLVDPVDGSALALGQGQLTSRSGNSYPIDAAGYATLLDGGDHPDTGDDEKMLAARETFLSRAHFAPFVEAVSQGVFDAIDDADLSADCAPVICEIGAGTGYYLSHALDDIDASRGIGIDISPYAAAKLADCHPRAGAVVADATRRLPIRTGVVDVITTVFAPRNKEEFVRILTDKGQVVVLSAVHGHLSELRAPLGIHDVEEGHLEKMIAAAGPELRPVTDPTIIEFGMHLDQESILTQIGMSPSAQHIDPKILAERVATLPPKMDVTAKAAITRFEKTTR